MIQNFLTLKSSKLSIFKSFLHIITRIIFIFSKFVRAFKLYRLENCTRVLIIILTILYDRSIELENLIASSSLNDIV